jgi:hypothetical protein
MTIDLLDLAKARSKIPLRIRMASVSLVAFGNWPLGII